MDMFDLEPQQLLITPIPHPGESYMGFLLRTSEANGYSSVNTILRHAGLSENEMRSARPPLEKLAPLYGREVEDFKALGDTVTANGRYLPVMGHRLPAIYLRSKHARLCPDCVEEDGHVSAFWELRHATACHRHRKKALEICPVCERKLDWWRTGLATCACGHDLREAAGDEVTSVAVLTLLGIIEAKLRGQELKEESLSYAGFPVSGLKAMSLSTLLGILYRLENFLEVQDGVSPEHAALETAADIFNAWPTGFYRYLERVHAPKADMQATGLRGQFKSFYEAFFKGLPKDELKFMHEAFVEFGQHHWKQAAIHPRLQGDKSSNIVGIEGFAKAFKIRPHTVRHLLKTGVIKSEQGSEEQNGRKLFDLSGQLPFEFAEGKSLSLDDAAKILDIPAAVLRAYRARGYFEPHYLASPIVLYHERDVMELKADLLKDCPLLRGGMTMHQTILRKIMLKKLGPSEIKAAFIEAVRKREIQPVGRLGSKVGDLVLDGDVVKEYLEQLRSKINGTVSIQEAQAELEVDYATMTGLLKHRMLQYSNSELGIRINKASIQRFSGQFISCRLAARMKHMTQSQVLELCSSMGIRLFELANASGAGKHVFIARDQIRLLGINGTFQIDYLQAA